MASWVKLTWASVDLTSMMGTAAVTVISSDMVALRLRSTWVSLSRETMAGLSAMPMPESSAETWYGPGGRRGNWKTPSGPVTADLPAGRSSPLTWTLTPGSGSPSPERTTPEMEPVSAAKTGTARSGTRSGQSHAKRRDLGCITILLSWKKKDRDMGIVPCVTPR